MILIDIVDYLFRLLINMTTAIMIAMTTPVMMIVITGNTYTAAGVPEVDTST